MDLSKSLSRRSGHGPLYLAWKNLDYSLAPGGKKNDDKPAKVILADVSGSLKPGQLLAVLGPSGSGKTSLLNALAGRLPITDGARLTGSVLLNGAPAGDMALRSAYIEQADTLFALSSVTETLLFTATLRLSKHASDEDRRHRVDEVLAELGLLGCKDTLIGNEQVRGVSGGEKRRVSIGVHLIDNPMLVFLDEPTSGLDSFQALAVMDTLKTMAAKADRTVVASIHQPRSSIYSMLDMIMLLSLGRTIYYGRAGADCAAYFLRVGHPTPAAFNPADHFLDIISINHRSEAEIQRTTATVQALTAAWHDSPERKATADKRYSTEMVSADQVNLKTLAAAEVHPDGPGFWLPFRLLAARAWREQMRNTPELCMKYTMNCFFAVLFGIIYFRMNKSQTSIQDRTGILFFQAMNQAFGSTIGTSTLIPVQLLVVNRERAANLYSVLPFYCATFIITLPLELVPQLLYCSLVYYMTNLRAGFEHYVTFTGILALENFVGIALGMVLSASLRSVEMAPQLAPAVVILFLMFSGYFLNEESVPVYMSWMSHISFIRYAFQALIVNEFKGNDFDCAEGDLRCVDGGEWVEQLNFQDVTIAGNCAILMAMIVGFNVLAFAILVLRKPKFLQLSPSKPN